MTTTLSQAEILIILRQWAQDNLNADVISKVRFEYGESAGDDKVTAIVEYELPVPGEKELP